MTEAVADNPDPSSPSGEPAVSDEQILEFALSQLGPRSERHLRSDGLPDVRQRLAQGAELPDAVLGHIHSRLKLDPRLADEFAAHFVLDLMLMGRISMASSSRLRRFLDSGDLVLSVFGDVWAEFEDVRFESRSQYKRFFAQRLQWKAADQARRMTASTRREDLRVAEQPEELEHRAAPAPDPLRDAIRSEDRQRLILLLLRLKDRERRLLTQHLKGETLEAIAAAEGLSTDATRKALARAIEQAREYAARQSRS
jgi:RNA polymerase sigma factor (sigma-70 family)